MRAIMYEELITTSSQYTFNLGKIGFLDSLSLLRDDDFLLGIVRLFLDFTLCLESLNKVCVSPADFLSKITQHTEFTIRSHSKNL